MKAAGPALAQGVYAALVTPRRPDSTEADTADYLEYLDKVSDAGVDGLVFFGSTGEFVHFDISERMRVVSLAAKRSRLPVLVNVSHSTFAGARDLAEQAIDVGVSGLMLMPPYFYPYAEPEVRAFYEAFASTVAARIPLYIYNLPFFTTPMTSQLLGELLASGVFAGVKESSGDWEIFSSLVTARDRVPYRLMAGHERIYVRALQAGADGVVSGIAAALPELIVALQICAGDANHPSTAPLAARLDEFLSWIAQFPPTVAIKEAVDARGWLRSAIAAPLAPATADRLVAFRSWFESWLPATLHLCKAATVRP